MFIKNLACQNPSNLYEKLRSVDSIFLDSQKNGRYSYIALNPYLVFKSWGNKIEITKINQNNKKTVQKYKANPITEFQKIILAKPLKRKKSWPLFYGGAIGYFSYEAFKFFKLYEKFPKAKLENDLGLPQIYQIFPRDILFFDHKSRKLKLISQSEKQALRIIEKIEEKTVILSETECSEGSRGGCSELEILRFAQNDKLNIKSNLTFSQYKKITQKCLAYIKNGHSFQIKISQRFTAEIKNDPWRIYQKLRKINPSPYAAYLELDGFVLASASPEHLVKIENNQIETRPIGGTYPRSKNTQEDKKIIEKFKKDPKEAAEHSMLIDLERNDLGRVCEFGSIKLSEKMTLEKYSHLSHIVSNIKGKLPKNKNIFDCLEAMFPGGTITGCPKFRTMEIIQELEPIERGPYTGSIGFINFSGELDLNIIIRTLIIKNKIGYIQAGGGIVADSNIKREYAETIDKAKALFEAI